MSARQILQPLQPIRALTPATAGLAITSSIVATALTQLFLPFLEQNVFMMFLIAVLLSSLRGGLWSGLIAAALSTVGAAMVVFPPLGRPIIETPVDAMRLSTLATFSVVIAVLSQALIAARHRSEQRAHDARIGEESFRAIFDNTADAIYVAGPTGELLNVNHAALALHGFQRDEMLGQKWHSLMDPELNDLAGIREDIERAFGGEPAALEVWARHATDTPFPMEVRITAARYFDRDVVIAVGRDLSDRRRLEAQLRQSQKMDAIGRLAGGIAHDFNNLLTSIRGYAALMRDRVAHDPSLLEDLGEIEQAVELATAVTRQLLTFSRKQEYQPKLVSLNESLERMQQLLRRLIGERVELIVEKDPGLGLSMLDEGQIEQVVMNLVVNARDALRAGGGMIWIRTRNVDAGSPATPHVALLVTDDGIGMDEQTRARIFEPFYTTKEMGHGTGLGLATVYGIVKQSGGLVDVESTPGAGSTFSVMFPRIDPPARVDGDGKAAQPPQPAAQPARSPRSAAPAAAVAADAKPPALTVLLAEDETPVRQLVNRILTRRGYRVLEAANGQQALDLARAYDGRIDALVTDVIMPELTGPELAERLRAEMPELPVLFTSGYNEEGMEGTGVVEGLGIAFLQKPFVPDDLLRLLAQLLDAQQSSARA